MRIHVYEEELGDHASLIEKTADTGEKFYGLRLWLKSPREILDHSTPEDNDESAVTIWARSKDTLDDVLRNLQTALYS